VELCGRGFSSFLANFWSTAVELRGARWVSEYTVFCQTAGLLPSTCVQSSLRLPASGRRFCKFTAIL